MTKSCLESPERNVYTRSFGQRFRLEQYDKGVILGGGGGVHGHGKLKDASSSKMYMVNTRY